MHLHAPASRRGSAFIAVIGVMVLLLSMSIALTDTTVSSHTDSARRKDQVALTVTTESIGNLALNYLQNQSDLQTQLTTAQASPTTTYTITTGVATLATKDSASYLNGAAGGSGRTTTNGFDTWITWGHQGTVTVPFFGTNTTTSVYRIVSTVADGGPAKLYNLDGSQKAITDNTRYRRQRLEVLFVPFPSTFFKQAMYARKGYDYMGSASTDSWNSNSGSTAYSTSVRGARGDLSSEGNIIVSSNQVNGTAKPYQKIPLPTLTYNPPGNATNLPTTNLSSGAATVEAGPLATGNYRTPSINLSNKTISFAANSNVTIYVDGPVIINTSWDIPANCTVTIWQNNYNTTLGTTSLNGNIKVGCIQNPGAFRWISLFDGTIPDATNPAQIDVKMNGAASLGGVMIFPYANFMLDGGFEFFGSLIADSFKDKNGALGKVNGNFAFHYDESLANLTLPFPPTLVVVGWRAYPLTQSMTLENQQ